MKEAIQINLFFILFSLVFSTYIPYDGSKLIPISYSPNEDYDANEIVSTSALSQEMLSYYSWLVCCLWILRRYRCTSFML